MARSRKARIDALLEQQAEALERLTDEQSRLVLRAYEDSRRLLREQLAAINPAETPATAQHIRVMLAQSEAGVAEMRSRLGEALAGAERKAHDKALKDLLKLVRKAEPEFRDTGGQVELGIVQRLSARQGLALHQYSVKRYGAQTIEAIQREIAAGVAAGLTQRQLADRIAAAGGSVLAGLRGRAELIARMETNRAYNDGALESIHELARYDAPADPTLKKIDEFFDARNHPFSRAAHGTTALPGDPFEVPISKVAAAAKAIKRKAGGVLWPRKGNAYVGHNLPAHYNDRGRIVPWKASWGAG